MDPALADAYLQRARDRHLEHLLTFLRIPSVSTLSAHRGAMTEAANWLADCLRGLGTSDVRILPTAGHPVVYGHWHAADGLPTVLIYGHYDVQPVDPIAEWESPPFEPEIRNGRIYARGAMDDKGMLYAALAALDAVRSVAGAPPLNLKFLVEGEEEIFSPNLELFIREHRELLSADLAVSADGSMWDADTPSLTVGGRGLVALQIDVRGARTDLHGGTYGGVVPNPIDALTALLAGMRAPRGRVSIEGFYDNVRLVPDAERRQIALTPFDETAYRARLGVRALDGEPEYTPVERLWIRPVLQVNGIWGGFQGDGTKTVLPAEAHAKITCRLVPDQDPDRVLAAIERHVRLNAPAGADVTVTRFPGKTRPYLMLADHPALTVAASVLKEVYGRDPIPYRMGGTLPFADIVKRELGAWLVFFAFGEGDCHQHAPNEFMRLRSLDRGMRAYARLFDALGTLDPRALRAS